MLISTSVATLPARPVHVPIIPVRPWTAPHRPIRGRRWLAATLAAAAEGALPLIMRA